MRHTSRNPLKWSPTQEKLGKPVSGKFNFLWPVTGKWDFNANGPRFVCSDLHNPYLSVLVGFQSHYREVFFWPPQTKRYTDKRFSLDLPTVKWTCFQPIWALLQKENVKHKIKIHEYRSVKMLRHPRVAFYTQLKLPERCNMDFHEQDVWKSIRRKKFEKPKKVCEFWMEKSPKHLQIENWPNWVCPAWKKSCS